VHLILSDFRLSGMNGIEAISRARQYLNEAVPAIIITGDTSTACVETTASSGFRILQKPLDATLLRESLKASIASRQEA
jgi:CheY-like chemotaxis protein